MRSLSAALTYAMMQQETDIVPLVLLTITHPTLAQPIRLVNNAPLDSGSNNIVRGGQTYVAFPFDLTLPDDVERQAPRGRLSVQNVTREIVDFIRVPPPAPQVTMEVINAAAPEEGGAFFGPFDFSAPEYDDKWVETDLVIADESRMEASHARYDGTRVPALFRAAA